VVVQKVFDNHEITRLGQLGQKSDVLESALPVLKFSSWTFVQLFVLLLVIVELFLEVLKPLFEELLEVLAFADFVDISNSGVINSASIDTVGETFDSFFKLVAEFVSDIDEFFFLFIIAGES